MSARSHRPKNVQLWFQQQKKKKKRRRMNDIYAAKTWFSMHVATFRCFILAVLHSFHWISFALNFTQTEMKCSIHLIMHATCNSFFMMLSSKHTWSTKSVGLHKNRIRYHLQIEIGNKKEEENPVGPPIAIKKKQQMGCLDWSWGKFLV